MKNLQQLFILGVATLFICSTVAIGVKNQSSGSTDNLNVITLDFTFSTPSIEQILVDDDVYDRVNINDLPNTCVLDKPRLPVKPVKLLLVVPQGYPPPPSSPDSPILSRIPCVGW